MFRLTYALSREEIYVKDVFADNITGAYYELRRMITKEHGLKLNDLVAFSVLKVGASNE